MKFKLVLISALFLTACGGGDSSSEPSGITYTGSQSATLNVSGVSIPGGVVHFVW